ncbi:MAG: hypothetical protein ACT4PV_14120 [Planctomycetaceae bacterium]
MAVLAREPSEAAERMELAARLSTLARREVDLLDLRRATTVLRKQVVSTGLALVVVDEGERRRFEDGPFSACTRLNEERRAILDRVRAAEGRVHDR